MNFDCVARTIRNGRQWMAIRLYYIHTMAWMDCVGKWASASISLVAIHMPVARRLWCNIIFSLCDVVGIQSYWPSLLLMLSIRVLCAHHGICFMTANYYVTALCLMRHVADPYTCEWVHAYARPRFMLSWAPLDTLEPIFSSLRLHITKRVIFRFECSSSWAVCSLKLHSAQPPNPPPLKASTMLFFSLSSTEIRVCLRTNHRKALALSYDAFHVICSLLLSDIEYYTDMNWMVPEWRCTILSNRTMSNCVWTDIVFEDIFFR